jgi:Domain of unknown function (DUF4279)
MAVERGAFNAVKSRSIWYDALLFVVSDELTGREIVTKIGVEPDEIWTKGEFSRPGHSRVPSRTSGIRFDSGLPNDAPIADHIDAVLKRVEPVADRLGKLAAERGLTEPESGDSDPWIHFLVLIVAGPDQQTVHLDQRQIAILARLGAEVEIELSFDVEEQGG